MKAVVRNGYGPPEVLRLEDVPRPEPAENEVLVQVHTTSVGRGDCHDREGTPFVLRLVNGPRRPRRPILGQEYAGEVVEVGSAVTEFAVGDRVFGALPTMATRAGTWAEFVAVPDDFPIAHIPEGLSFEQAGCISDGFLCAVNVMKPAEIGPGTEVLVYGASGAIGTACVQLAKHYGARVTAVCDTRHVELVRSLGADEVLDYTRGEDFTKRKNAYEVIVDAVGKHSFLRSRGSLKKGGVYLPTDNFLNVLWWGLTKRADKRVRFEFPRYKKEYLVVLKQLLETGEYTPVIDRTYPLEDVIEASRYVDTQQKTGNVALTVASIS
jgi:NADPH:quinone reductase-like Zn-dependent oxidoreductase